MVLPANLVNPRGEGFHAELDELYLRVAATPSNPARISTWPVSPPKVDTSVNPEDVSDDVGAVFSRSDFQGGDGLLIAHRPDRQPDDASRYLTGRGVDVVREDPGDRSTFVSLTSDVELLTSGTMGGGGSQIATIGAAMTLTDDTPGASLVYGAAEPIGSVRVVTESDLGRNAASWEAGTVTELPFGAILTQAVRSLVAHNGSVYAGHETNGVAARPTSGAWSLFSSEAIISDLFSVKGRLIGGASGGVLQDIVADPGPNVDIVTGGGEWVGVTDAGAFVLAANTDGYVYALTYDPQEAAWVIQAQTFMGEGNIPTCITSLFGEVVIGTEQRTWEGFGLAPGTHGTLWRASVGDDGALVDLDIIREWPTTAPRIAVAFNNNVYLYVSPDLWQLDLRNSALHRFLTFTSAEANAAARNVSIVGVVIDPGSTFEMDRFFVYSSRASVTPINSNKLTATLAAFNTSNRVSVGTLVSPHADFFTASDKVWLEVTAEAAWFAERSKRATVFPTGTGPDSTIAIYARASAGPETTGTRILVGTLSAGTESATVNLNALSVPNSRFIRLEAEFTRNTGLFGGLPYRFGLLNFTVRGVLAADEQRYVLPVNVSDMIERPYRRPFRVQDQGELLWQALKSKEGTQVALTIYRPSLAVEGVLETVDTPIVGYTPRGSATTVSVLTIRGTAS